MFTLISTGVIRAWGGHVVKVTKPSVDDVPVDILVGIPVDDGSPDGSAIVMVGGPPDTRVIVRPFVVKVLSRDTRGRWNVSFPMMATRDPVEFDPG